MTDMNSIPASGLVYVTLRTPEQLANDAMRISAALDLILSIDDAPNVTCNAAYTMRIQPVIELCAELANKLGNDIARLERSGRG